ncbi:MAG TPA: T9SS type A sorting domain-containing protein [Flavobacteriaceae bacterium]|nr:T9SS type A sorting domain-containing protein [Flavobacteriaceae bacterium]HIO00125.1 T9SS type A sorting domain-containing protein [Flavobacteriaceae bacterium]
MKIYQLLTLFLMCATLPLSAQDLKIYVSDAENFSANSGTIIQYDIDGTNPQDFIVDELSWPQDIVFLPNTNEVIISNLNSGRITKYNAVDGTYINDFATVAGGPTRMKIGPDGLLYVIQWSTTDNKVLRYELDGTFVDEFTDIGVPRSIGIDWDAGGNLYISSFGSGTVTSFDTSGNSTGIFVDNSELSGPTNIYFDDDGNLQVFDWNDGDVEQYDSTGAYIDTFITDVSQVEGVDFLPNGNIILGHGNDSSVKEYLPDGTFVGELISSGLGGLDQPNAVILFDRSTLGLEENEKVTSQIVSPSVGTVFNLLEAAKNRFDTIQIFNTSGRLIDTLSPKQQQWSGLRVTEGTYLVVGMSQGRKTTQKIVVKK